MSDSAVTPPASGIELLAGLFSDGAVTVRSSERALVGVFRLLAERLGVSSPVITGASAVDRPADDLARLAGANNLILREVRFAPGWMTTDINAAIGFVPVTSETSDGLRPVALLRSGRQWRLVDPVTGGTRRLSVESAASIGGPDYALYPALPSGPVGALALARFGYADIRLDLVGFALTTFLTGIAAALLPVATGFITASVLPGREFELLFQILAMVLMIVLGNVGTRLATELTQLRMDGRLGSQLRTAAIDRMVRSASPFVAQMPPALRAMGIRMIEGWHRNVRHLVLAVSAAAMTALPSLGLMLLIAPTVAAVVFAAILLAALVAAAVARRQAHVMTVGGMASMGWISTAYEALAQLDTVRAAHAEAAVLNRWAEAFLTAQRRLLRAGVVGAAGTALQAALQAAILFVAFLALAIAKFAAAPDVSLTFVMATMAVAGCATTLVGTLAAIAALGVQARFIKPFLEEPARPRSFVPVPKLSGAVRLSSISARRLADGPMVLSDVSLEVHAGEHIGIVGASGSGKSTILSVLIGLIQPETGSVTFDGIDLRKLDAAAVRRQIGFGGQGSKLFAGTIRDNVRAGLDLGDDAVWEALRLAAVDEEVAEMGLGLSTLIGDADPTISGGQQQRILIARAIAARPRLVILDEATSAIDPDTRARITANLAELGASIISVAHRLDALRAVDRIYVVDAGRIVEAGTPTELVARNGVFAGMLAWEFASQRV